MKKRCYDPNRNDYRFYGLKGIKVCNEWLQNPSAFEIWALKNRYKNNLTIDRIDSCKDYEPNNCRWISSKENSTFKSTTHYIEIDNVLMSGRGWSKQLGYGINYINRRIRTYGIDNTIDFIKEKLKEKNK